MVRGFAIGLLAMAGTAFSAEPEGLKRAHQLWQTGKYAESLEACDKIAPNLAPDDASGRARVALVRADGMTSTGKSSEAIEILRKSLGAKDVDADMLARIAEIELDLGLWDEADADAKASLAISPDHLLGRFVTARLHEAKGETKEARVLWKWFVDHYNGHQGDFAKDPEALILIGQAAERYYRAQARGEDLAESLNDVINEIYESALKADSKCWQAPWLEGRLFLAGYAEGSAKKELNRALQINPVAPEILVTIGQSDLQGYKLAAGRKKAEEALETNPKYTPAMVLLADLNISDEHFADARDAARRALAENPKDADALARLAAASRLLVDPIGAAAAEAVALSLNPHPSDFYAALGERLADRRKYPSAERAFLLAMHADPERADPKIGLGMLYMQIGREAEARDLFLGAFAADPFNVRADNMMKVLRHMSGYGAVKSPHFSVTFDPKQDALLGKYMAKFLEESLPSLDARFHFTPPGLTQIEIMKNHQWFSGRTTALPFIPTVGACTGKVVALASPTVMKKPFNWSRVMIHEVTHVITLQQTDFNIPHWYTEALAVESEQSPRPQAWNKLLQERVPTRTKLLNLDTINLGFIRPEEPDQRQLAYCQAQLYSQYMTKRYGEDANAKMLEAYRTGLTTDRALKSALGAEKKDFEEGYLKFLDEVVKTIRTRVDDEPPITFSQLERKLKEKPDDAELNARMAYEHFARRDLKEARPFVEKALKIQPHHPLASYVKARMYTTIGDNDAALATLEPALDKEHPNERVVDLLADLLMNAGRLDEAESLYEMAHKDDPFHTKWIASLARVHLRKGNKDALLDDLAMIAANDADDLDTRRTLAQYHARAGRFAESARWAMECLYIKLNDPIYHVMLADARVGLKEYDGAIEEYRVALELKPKKPDDLKVKIARALHDGGKVDEASKTLDEVLKGDPDHPEAKALKEEWAKAKA